MDEDEKEKAAEAVDSEDGVRYNRNDKSLWNLLSKQDKARVYERIDSMHHLGNTEKQLPNGNYLIDIDNKIIETDASFDSPSLESIVELSVFSKKISKARDLLYEYINNGRPIWECVDLINKVCEEKVATLYQSQNSGDNSVVNGQRQNNRGTRQNGGELGNRRGNSAKNRRAISYHFKDDGSQTVTYSDGTTELRFSRSAQDSTDSAAQKGYHESTEQTVDEKISEKMKHSSKAVSELYANWKQNAGQGYPENSINQRGIIYQDGRKPPQGSLDERSEKIFLKKALTKKGSCGIIPSLSEDSRFR